MKVCLVSFEYPPDSLVMGGAGTYADFLRRGLESIGVDVHVITTGNKPSFIPKLYKISVPNVMYWRRLFFANAATNLLRRLNEEHNFDLVHFNEPYIITICPSLPIVCTFHTTQLHELTLNLQEAKNVQSGVDLIIKNPFGYLFDVITSSRSNKIICPNSDIAKHLEYCLVDKRKIKVVPNGIDIKIFDEANRDSAFLNGKLEKDPYVLYMGRLTSRKGVHYLIEAFRKIKRECSELKLIIAGRGDFEQNLKSITQGIKDVVFLGFVDSIGKKKTLYENCLCVVIPSIYEAFPMVALEAMACGKPIIGSDVGGIRLLIRHGKNGFLNKPRDVKAIAASIRRLYEDTNLRKRMGVFSRKLVEKEFSAEKMVNETLKVYESVL